MGADRNANTARRQDHLDSVVRSRSDGHRFRAGHLAASQTAEFGLSQFSASRGLDRLEGAGLVSTIRRTGLSPVVTIVDATAVQQ